MGKWVFEIWNKVDKVNFDSGFDKNNPKVLKEKLYHQSTIYENNILPKWVMQSCHRFFFQQLLSIISIQGSTNYN